MKPKSNTSTKRLVIVPFWTGLGGAQRLGFARDNLELCARRILKEHRRPIFIGRRWFNIARADTAKQCDPMIEFGDRSDAERNASGNRLHFRVLNEADEMRGSSVHRFLVILDRVVVLTRFCSSPFAGSVHDMAVLFR